jgi:methyl-accepting chemotaxis protein
MRDVAVGMAGGNFSARADDTQRGEVGQLGRSLNFLSEELSKSISQLVVERNRLRQTIDACRRASPQWTPRATSPTTTRRWTRCSARYRGKDRTRGWT